MVVGTYSPCARLLFHTLIWRNFLSVYCGRERWRGLLGWFFREWSTAPLYIRLGISVLTWLLWHAAPLSLLPSLENWRLVYCWVGWLPRAANPQPPQASYMLHSIMFGSTKIGRIIIFLGGMIYGRRRIILFLTVILRVSYLKICCGQCFLRKNMMHLKGLQN